MLLRTHISSCHGWLGKTKIQRGTREAGETRDTEEQGSQNRQREKEHGKRDNTEHTRQGKEISAPAPFLWGPD